MTPPETVSTTASGDAHATAPLTCTFGPQGPTLGDLIDAYLQDYQVRQFRSVSTARGRTAHLAAFFGRAARAAGFTTHQIRQYQLARRAAGAATGTINRETSALHRMGTLAVHWGGSTPCPGSPTGCARIPPARASSSTPNTSPSASTCPHRGRTFSTSPTIPADASRRSSASLGRRSTKPAASSGSRQGARRRWWDASSPSRPPSPRPWRDPGSPLVFHRDGIPIRRWRTAWRTACQAAGVPTRFLHDCRRTAARNLIRANVPERVAMLLTGHKSRAIFDRYNIIHEQELLEAGDQLVAYLAQQAQAVPARRRPHAVDPPEHGHAPGPAAGSSGGRVPPVGAGKHTRTASCPSRACRAPPAPSRAKAGRPTGDHRLSRHPWLAPL